MSLFKDVVINQGIHGQRPLLCVVLSEVLQREREVDMTGKQFLLGSVHQYKGCPMSPCLKKKSSNEIQIQYISWELNPIRHGQPTTMGHMQLGVAMTVAQRKLKSLLETLRLPHSQIL